MAILKSYELTRFLKSPDPSVIAILVFGNDTGSVGDHARTIVRSIAGSLDDPFNIVQLSDADLQGDPARLADEAQAISMMGGRRVIWVRPAGAAFAKAAAAYLDHATGDSLIVAEAGSLTKTDALRKLFESHAATRAVACYEDTARDLAGLIDRTLTAAGLQVTSDARERLMAMLGADRMLSLSELNKLATYCYGSESVTLANVEAICGDASALSLDDLTDRALEGDVTGSVTRMSAILDSGVSPSAVLSALARHIAMLQSLAAAMENGRPADAAIKAHRPMIFFKRQAGISRQLRLWPLRALSRASASILSATAQCRTMPQIEAAIVERTMLALAATAGRQRMR